MAIINTGAVERTITGVNESEVNSQATIMNLVENSDSGDYGNNPASDSLVESPDGTISAVMPIPDSNSDRFEYLIDGGTYPTDTKLVYSWYRKRVTTPLNTSYIGDLRITSLSNMTNTGLIAQIETDVNGFDRFQAVVNITDGSLPSKVRGYFGYSIGIGNSSVAYWGHQLETGEEARAYAPTNGAALFIDNNSTSVVTNTGVVEREIEASHDANFVPPLGDELITNGGFDSSDDWILGSDWVVVDGKAVYGNSGTSPIRQFIDFELGKKYILNFKVSGFTTNYEFDIYTGQSLIAQSTISNSENHSILFDGDGGTFLRFRGFTNGVGFSIDNVSVKEVLVNRESTVNNTGAVEREIEASHDANFVRPLGDEIFDNQELTPSSGWTINENRIDIDTANGTGNLNQLNSIVIGKEYIMSLDANLSVGRIKFQSDANGVFIFSNNIIDYKFTASTTSISFRRFDSLTQGYIENVSVKEVLVNRESTVINTGVVERDIEGVNESDEMFPDNTESSVLNVGEEILPLLESLESRSTYYENEQNTVNILKNLNC